MNIFFDTIDLTSIIVNQFDKALLPILYINNLTKQQKIMCFLSMYRLKSLISIGIVITLLIGISLLYVLVYSFIISSITAQVQPQFRTLLITVFLTSSLLLIFSSLSGIYGLIRRKNKFVVIYAITMVVYMITFLILAIKTMQTPQFITSQCEQQNSDYNQTSNAAKDLLCKEECQCYFTNTQKYTNQSLNIFGITNYSNSESNLPINAQNCPTWDNNTYPLTIQMTILESFFNCSGWCQPEPNPYYLFTNINFGIPSFTCVLALSQFLEKFGLIIEISSFAVSAFLMIIAFIITCLWLHPDRGLKYDSLEMFKNTLLFVEEKKQQQVELQ